MIRTKILFSILIILFAFPVVAQNKPSTWFELGFSKELIKNLKIEFNPELRLQDAFRMDSTNGFKMDSYILEGGLSYKLNKYLSFAGYYRFEEEYKAKYKRKVDENGEKIKPKQYEYVYSDNSANRLAFDIKSGFDLNRLGFQFRIRYTQGLYYNNDAYEYRYRAKVDYDIKGSKLVPYASVEAFHDASILKQSRHSISGGLKTFDKIRTTAGVSYKINKNNELTLFYRLQNNRFTPVENQSAEAKDIKEAKMNIIGLGYSHDF
jgi:hypothetical protein